jgi:sulfur relay (sulfurtransferase) DsrF/TusC family protein
LPGVATGARGNQAALKRVASQEANLIVIAHHVLKLAQNQVPHELRQMIIQCIPVYLKRVILAMLTSIDKRGVVALRQGSVKIHPATPGRTEDLAMICRVSTEPPDQFAQLRCG